MDLTNFVIFLKNNEITTKTINDNIRTINNFFDKFSLFNMSNLLEYKAFLISHFKSGTINKKITHLRNYAKFINSDYVLRFVPNNAMKEQISLNDYKRFLKFALQYDNEYLYLFVRTLFETGIRIHSTKDITFESIKNKTFYSQIKNTAINPPLLKDLVSKLKIYCVRYNIKGQIFTWDKNKVYREMEFICGKARIKKSRFKPHAIRSLAIRTLLDNGKSTKFVSEFAGHKNIKSLTPYTANRNINDKRKQIKILEDISKSATI
jgi:integrase